ncbi:hypothetical protein HYC85_001953 [Camellia sinensis]|uniref:Uncharacterized protein n=1 Tax=Camellia sinensis TaxID=4442 RepID=A0A7J7I8M5_CAMSI|nr:hypothetical protein HYC85_001953 [Camellia sinensis]
MAKHQETLANSSMMELSQAVSEMLRGGSTGGEEEDERVKSTPLLKREEIEAVIQKTDDLRLRTLKEVMDILSAI